MEMAWAQKRHKRIHSALIQERISLHLCTLLIPGSLFFSILYSSWMMKMSIRYPEMEYA